MSRRVVCLFIALLGLLMCYGAPAAPIRLVTVLVVDGLSTEMLLRHADRLQPDGLGRMLRQGIVYTGAEIPWLTTFTAVGHAGLFTGALPDQHGIIGNEWINPSNGELVYSVEDPNHQILDFPGKAHEGTSPANLLTTTIGDELIRASGGKARVFSVSAKDRAAILPAGKRGKAFWYHKQAATMVTSSYYYRKSPDWLNTWRKGFPLSRYRKTVWGLFRTPEVYSRLAADDRVVENSPLGVTFPHDLGKLEDDQFYAELAWTPFIDEVTLDFALAVLEAESLGKNEIPDILCISFSAMDYVNHRYGPDSLEAEDTLYRVDALIASLLYALDQRVGLDHVLVALSADHGFGRAPEVVMEEGLPAGRVTKGELETRLKDLSEQISAASGQRIRAQFLSPFLYLRGESGETVDGSIRLRAAGIAATWPWIQWAVSIDDLRSGNIPATPFHTRALTAYAPGRGGDVLLIARPWYIVETSEKTLSATHGSPYTYDTRIPVVFLGPHTPGIWVSRPISALDIAATLASCLRITPTPSCIGQPLPEVCDTMSTPGGKISQER